ncbi:MAG: hypothetical protein ACE5D4_03195 [Thermodesulfobacteriota bacterium]
MTGTAGNVEGKLTGTVDVTVEDDTLGPVSGATVNFTFTWLKEGQPTTKQMNCTTDGTGQCSATTKPMENAAFVDISLVNVNHPTLTYVMGDNTIGTSTVTVP